MARVRAASRGVAMAEVAPVPPSPGRAEVRAHVEGWLRCRVPVSLRGRSRVRVSWRARARVRV